jgi:hypothetical protein
MEKEALLELAQRIGRGFVVYDTAENGDFECTCAGFDEPGDGVLCGNCEQVVDSREAIRQLQTAASP